MKTRSSSAPSVRFVAALALILAISAAAAEPDPRPLLTRLDNALKGVASYEYGKDAEPLRAAEQIVVAAATEPQQRVAVEQRLLTVLAGSATRDAKEFVCRQLFIVGTPKCIPALEGLLADPALSHMARYVLGRLEYPEALAALERALANTSGPLRIGIVTTLGERRYAPAVPGLARLLESADPALVRAAAAALGTIGSEAAAQALDGTRAQSSGQRRAAIDDALLACADRSLAESENARAMAIYRRLYAPDQPQPLRVAALRGLVAANPTDAMGVLTPAIQGSDPDLAASAIGFSRSVEGTATTKALAALAPALTADTQALLIGALGARGDRAALPAVVASTSNAHETVRLAAFEALGNVGDGSVVGLLVRAAATRPDNEAQTARSSLVRLSAPDTDPALIKALGTSEAKPRIEAIRALAKRHATVAVNPVLALANDNDAAVRETAIRAAGELAGEAELPALVALLVKPKDAADRDKLQGAIETAFRRVPAPDRQAAPVLAALTTAPAEARPYLVRLLGRTATPGALEAVRAGLKDPDAAVREAALRTLADWPDAKPADDLLSLVGAATEPTLKLIALRGYVRVAGLAPDPTAMYARALALAQRPEDKRLILSGLGTATSPGALDLVEPFLADDALRAEAGLALVQIADQVRPRDPARARAAVERVLASTKDPGLQLKAIDALDRIDPYQNHILAWVGAGPFRQAGKDAEALFAIAFPPEQPDARDVPWQPITKGVGKWEINLDQAMGSGDDLAGYARTRVWSPAAQEARFEFGSDDGIKVWLNGKVIHSNYTHRGCGPKQDIVKARLETGWNDLLLKIVNRGGGWAFACRIRQADGGTLEGFKVEAR